MSYHYPPHHPAYASQRPHIVVHDHDVLNGRGVNIAEHPGNERYRTLISSRYDPDFCTKYTTAEKRALAEEVIKHIQDLNPPGRFLKREGRQKGKRGLTGPWDELSHEESLKKVCQALRDCCRSDRKDYAADVKRPEDVIVAHEKRKQSGLTNKQQAAAAAAAVAAHMDALDVHTGYAESVGVMPGTAAPPPLLGADMGAGAMEQITAAGRLSPTMAEAAHTLYAKRQRTEDGVVPVAHDPALLDAAAHLQPSPSATAAAAAATDNGDAIAYAYSANMPGSVAPAEDDEAGAHGQVMEAL